MIRAGAFPKEMPSRCRSLTTADSNQQMTEHVAALRYGFNSAAAVIHNDSDDGHAPDAQPSLG